MGCTSVRMTLSSRHYINGIVVLQERRKTKREKTWVELQVPNSKTCLRVALSASYQDEDNDQKM